MMKEFLSASFMRMHVNKNGVFVGNVIFCFVAMVDGPVGDCHLHLLHFLLCILRVYSFTAYTNSTIPHTLNEF